MINGKGEVVGIVSEADLMRRAEIDTAAHKSSLSRLMDGEASAANDFVTARTRRVSDVMTRKVVTATEDTTLRELVDLMERHNVKRVPIGDDVLLGVVSRADLLKALLSREPDSPVLQPTEKALRKAVVEAVRQAYRVAAENVPGVRRVKSHLRSMPPSVAMGT